ncbi:MAG: hypothetical protein ACE5JD_01875 [Candidatus Methylomirabilia bacterium]
MLTRVFLRGGAFSYALLMGGENYLCLQRLSQARQTAQELFEDPQAEHEVARLTEWAQRGIRGLRQDIPFSVSQKVWGRVCRDSDLCLGRSGPFALQCFYLQALHRARHAHVVVVNHALLLSHLFSGGTIVPSHDAIIVACRVTSDLREVARFVATSSHPVAAGGLRPPRDQPS